MKIFELFGAVFIESNKADESLDKTESKAKKVASSLGKGIKSAAKWSAAIVGGAAAAGGAMLAAGNEFAETTDRIDKMSQKLGLTREGFQEWEFILSQSGASIDSMKSGMNKLNLGFDELKAGAGLGAEAFGKLGISIEDMQGKSREEVFEATIIALQGVSDESERAAIANDLLGKSAVELAPLFNSGAESVEKMKGQAKELGLIIGDDAIDAGVAFTDTMDQIKRSLGGLTTNLMSGLMPLLQQFMEFIQAQMPRIQDLLVKVFGAFSVAIENVIPLLMQLLETLLPPLINLIVRLASDVIPVLVSIVQLLITNVLPIVIDLFNILVETVLPPLLDILSLLVTKLLPPLIKLFTTVIKAVLPPLMKLFKVLIDTILPPVIELLELIIEEVLPVFIDLIVEIVETILPPLLELFTELVQTVLPPVIKILMALIKEVLPALITVIKFVADGVKTQLNFIMGFFKAAIAFIKGDWEGGLKILQDTFSKTFEAIKAKMKVVVDGIKVIFEGLGIIIKNIWEGISNVMKKQINFIIGGINTFIKGVNKVKVPDWVPGVGGKGVSIRTIPKLATGGNIIQSGKVIVGENGPELFEARAGARVTPLAESPDARKEETNINNNFSIAKLIVREEADIKKIARELFNLQLRQARG